MTRQSGTVPSAPNGQFFLVRSRLWHDVPAKFVWTHHDVALNLQLRLLASLIRLLTNQNILQLLLLLLEGAITCPTLKCASSLVRGSRCHTSHLQELAAAESLLSVLPPLLRVELRADLCLVDSFGRVLVLVDFSRDEEWYSVARASVLEFGHDVSCDI